MKKSKKILIYLALYFSLPLFALAVHQVSSPTLQPIPPDSKPAGGLILNTGQNVQVTPAPGAPTPVPPPPPGEPNPVFPPPTETYTVNGTNNTTTPALNPGDLIYYQTGLGYQIGVVTTPPTNTEFNVNGSPLPYGTYEIAQILGGPSQTLHFTTGSGANSLWINSFGDLFIPNLGDIVLLQEENSKPVWGIVTGTKNGFTFNDKSLRPLTNYLMTKIDSTSLYTSAVDAEEPGRLLEEIDFNVGDWVIGNTGAGYTWGIVTTGEKVSAGGLIKKLRLDGSTTPPKFLPGTRISKITPASLQTSSESNIPLYATIAAFCVLLICGIGYYIYLRLKK